MSVAVYPNAAAKAGSDDLRSTIDMIKGGCAPPLDDLLRLLPDEPSDLGLLPAGDRGQFLPMRIPLTEKERDLSKRFPGIRHDCWLYEGLKYISPNPVDGMIGFVLSFLHTAKSHWSSEVYSGRTQAQFRDWLPDYLEDESRSRWAWNFDSPESGLGKAVKLVRRSCGLVYVPLRVLDAWVDELSKYNHVWVKR